MINEIAKYINNKYGIENFLQWSASWIEDEREDLPTLIASLPTKLLYPFIEEGKYYRGMVVGDNFYAPADSNACSWSSSIASAEYFSEREKHIDFIERNGETAYGVIYKSTGPAVNLNKVINVIVEYAKENNMMSEELEYMEYIQDNYFSEKEFIAGFSVDESTLVSSHEYTRVSL